MAVVVLSGGQHLKADLTMSKGNSGGGAAVGGGAAPAEATRATIDMKAVKSMDALGTRQERLANKARAAGDKQAAKQHRMASIGYRKAAELHEQGRTEAAERTAKIAKDYAQGKRKVPTERLN